MERVGFLGLLLCGCLHMINGEILHVSWKEGNIAVLHCGRLTNGNVTWSRDVNGQRVDILTTHNGETTKHISDPDKRYGAGVNLVLTIFKPSQSDAGRYYCSGTTVELTVTSKNGSGRDGNTEHPSGTNDALKVVVGIVAGSCVVAVILLTLIGHYLYKMKAQSNIEQLYATVQKPKKKIRNCLYWST